MEKHFAYILENFKACYKLAPEISIGYGPTATEKVVIVKKADFPFEKIDDKTIPTMVWKDWKGTKIPFLFDHEDAEIFSTQGEQIVIQLDIASSAFYLLSGNQELFPGSFDEIGRFRYHESIQHKLGITKIPVVNYYFDILKTAIEKAYNTKLELKMPKGHEFTACLTHDIDNCESAWVEGSAAAVRKGNYVTPIGLIFSKLFLGRDKWFNLDEILAIEQKYNAHSAFYFLCQHERTFGHKNADYRVSSPKYQKVIKRIMDSGSEVGLHGSFGTHNNYLNFVADYKRLKTEPKGNRFHFLEFEMGTTPHLLEEAKMKYDTTLYFAEQAGFRNSYCYPFKLYNFKDHQTSKVWEVPLVLMDTSLNQPHYMGLSQTDSCKLIDELTAEVKKFNGVFTILWHNTYFSDYKFKGWKDVYIHFLETCKKENALMTSPWKLIENMQHA